MLRRGLEAQEAWSVVTVRSRGLSGTPQGVIASSQQGRQLPAAQLTCRLQSSRRSSWLSVADLPIIIARIPACLTVPHRVIVFSIRAEAVAEGATLALVSHTSSALLSPPANATSP